MLKICAMEEDHVDCIVEMHMKCFPGFFLTSLGKGFLKQYYKSLLQSERSVALIITDDAEEPRGFVTGVINPSGFYMELLRTHWYRFFVLSLLEALKRPKIVPRLLRALAKPKLSISNENVAELTSICVDPEYENIGYGKALVQAFSNEVRKKECKEIVLYTDADKNERVNSFYKDLGFIVARSFTTPEGRNMHEYRRYISRHNERAFS